MKTLDFVSPFTYFFKEKDWPRKFVITSLLTYTLVGAAPVFGWMIEIVGKVGEQETEAITELSEWKRYWRSGGKFAGVNALWLLPVLVAVILLYLPLLFTKSMGTISLLAVFGFSLGCVGIFLLAYSLLYVLFIPAMQILLVRNDSIRQAANPVRLWKTVRKHIGEYLLVFLIVGLALFNITLVLAAFTLSLLLPPLLIYTGLVGAHFAGQLMRLEQA
jgi:hypothetical protein